MRDWIRLRGMTFYAYHGVFASEQELGQRFEVDVEMRLNLRPAGAGDDLGATIDYTRVYQVVREKVLGQKFKLLERLAETIANAVLADFPVEQVIVRVRKPHVSLGGLLDTVEIEITRDQDGDRCKGVADDGDGEELDAGENTADVG